MAAAFKSPIVLKRNPNKTSVGQGQLSVGLFLWAVIVGKDRATILLKEERGEEVAFLKLRIQNTFRTPSHMGFQHFPHGLWNVHLIRNMVSCILTLYLP